MLTAHHSPSERRKLAEQGVAALGEHRDNQLLVRVRCPASHHVAAVFDTEHGPAFVTLTGSHSHGSRDFVDVPHGAHRHEEYFDLLEVSGDDELPAWCDCGTWKLSRAALLESVATRQRTVILG